VSQVHSEVTRRIFAPIRPGAEQSLRSITNGVHVPTWIAPALDSLFERHLGADWKMRHDDPSLWEQVFAIPDAELWQVRQSLRSFFLGFLRERARKRWIDGLTHLSTVCFI